MGRIVRGAVVAAALAAVLAGCSSEDAGEQGASAGSAADSSAQGPANGSADTGGAAADPAVAPAPGAELRTIRTGDITVRVEQLSAAATAVRASATGLGGFVASESTGVGEGDGIATLVLRVPEARTEQLVEAILRTGELVSRSTNAEDVTAAIADVDSRVASQTRSLQRVRALLDRAASINDIVMLERELAQRETELEALQARQRSLNDRADLSTITATLRLPDADGSSVGFLAGLERGWDAFLGALVVALTVLGALIPFAVPLALVALVVWTARRRLRRRPGPAPTTP